MPTSDPRTDRHPNDPSPHVPQAPNKAEPVPGDKGGKPPDTTHPVPPSAPGRRA